MPNTQNTNSVDRLSLEKVCSSFPQMNHPHRGVPFPPLNLGKVRVLRLKRCDVFRSESLLLRKPDALKHLRPRKI
jgi:hypothetical protein